MSGGGADVVGGLDSNPGLTVSSPQPAGDPNKTPKKGWIAEGVVTGGGKLRVWAICKR